MEITLEFLWMFFVALWYALPIVGLLVGLIILLGHIVGRWEGWSPSDSIYYAFITATTVGYGDFHPKRAVSKHLAVVISFVGLLLTGIVVALALHAAEHAFKDSSDYSQLVEKVQQIEKKYKEEYE
jgi:voltage-gated potassium channel